MKALDMIGKLMAKCSPVDKNVAIYNNEAQNVISFFAPKEGAGVTTFCVSIAHLIAKQGRSVCVLDLNFKSHDTLNYFADEDDTPSVIEWVRNRSKPIQEYFIRPKKYPKITLLSADAIATPDQYCNFQSSDIEVLVDTLRDIFDYVLIDSDDINSNATYAALEKSGIVFSFIQPLTESLDRIALLSEFLDHAGFAGKMANVIQNMIYRDYFQKEEIHECGLNYSGVATFSQEVYRHGANHEIISECKMETEAAKQMQQLMLKMSDIILDSEVTLKNE